MKLPEITHPTYTITLPKSKHQIRFRPYLVKEQKILMLAIESKDENAILDAIMQILNNCLLDSNVNLSEYCQVDVEYYFYQLRARTYSETITPKYRCNNVVDDKKCNNVMEASFNLTEDLDFINLDVDPLIPITDTIGIKLRVPYFNIDDIDLDIEDLSTDDYFKEIVKNIEFIYDENNTYRIDESNFDETVKFLEQLSSEQFLKIKEFFSKLPKIVKILDVTCDKCGFEHKIVVEDIFDFFF